MMIVAFSGAVSATGAAIPPCSVPVITVPWAIWVFDPLMPYLNTLAWSCQPAAEFGVVPLTHAPVSAMTVPPTTAPPATAEVQPQRILARLLLVVAPVLKLAVMHPPRPA